MQQDFSTPMMKQYLDIKKQYPDCLLFYRMGDFYELFLDDAQIGAKILNITLTGKSNGKNGRIPMAGVPYHAVDAYLSKLVKSGYKVAICEQLSPPNKKGLVKRDVVRIVTPGTVMDEKALEQKENNYIISLAIEKDTVGMTVADISTGYFSIMQTTTKHYTQTLIDELARIHPAECILPEELYNNAEVLGILKKERDMNIFPYALWKRFADDAKQVLTSHFKVATLAGFGVHDKPVALKTAAALLGYLQETQKGTVDHIRKITSLPTGECLLLDRSTMINLELFATLRDHETKGSLLSVLDTTVTAMGGRLLKQWLRKPLATAPAITLRHDAVAELVTNASVRTTLSEQIENVNDIERLISRLAVGLGNGRDIINLTSSLKTILEVKKLLSKLTSPLFQEIEHMISSELHDTIVYVQKHIVPEPPISIREGHMIQQGVHQELDRLRKIVAGSRDWIIELEKKEREKTGIASLKVRFNQVFGFYIEVSKSNLALVPAVYMRKQTLVNAERFITPELKEQEEIILTAEERINDLEYTLFQEVLQHVLSKVAILQDAAESIATLDCLVSFAHNAEKNNYVRPTLLTTGEIKITNGRHPVVEQLLENTQFVPNGVTLDDKSQLLIITGPNMAGKSVFIRQVALIVLLNQIGSFVPAEQASLSIVDHIFVRSGASDVITSGLSTFMVEMVETAHILHHATDKSLIIMDEIGRGTSTYDGISIAWSVAEYLVSQQKNPKTLFATHYHELQVLEERYPTQIRNFHMSIVSEKEQPIFLHTLAPGGASHSFGVAVAKLAGIPDSVIGRAKELLQELEQRNQSSDGEHSKSVSGDSGVVVPPPQNDKLSNFINTEFDQIDISTMTPLEALNTLAKLKENLKKLA